MAPTIEDNTEADVSLDNIERGDNSDDTYIVPHFMPAPRDIMNWFPCPNVASLT
jgi:hypothetical protein